MEFATRLSPHFALEKLSARQPTALSEAKCAWAGLTFAKRAPGNGNETRAGESGSAAFRSRRHVLDRNVLRMRLVQADVLVVAMMPIMLVMAAAKRS